MRRIFLQLPVNYGENKLRPFPLGYMGSRYHSQDEPQGIDEDMALAPLDTLGGIFDARWRQQQDD